MNSPLVSVVIPTYNRCEMLRAALESVISQDTDVAYEIVVVDDGSTDHTRQVVEELGAGSKVCIRYVCTEQHGNAEAMNKGVSEASGQWIACFDDDECAAPDWLSNLLSVAQAHGAQIVGGAVRLEKAASALHPVCRGILGEHRHFAVPSICTGKKLPGSGNLLISKHVFRAIGLFDTTMKGGGSDRELLLRARSSSYLVWYAPDAVIVHRMQPHRYTPEYFRWTSLRQGGTLAEIDYKQKRLGWSLLLRLCYTALVALPLCAIAHLSGNKGRVLGRKTILWRTAGYIRRTFSLVTAQVLGSPSTNGATDFRYERQVFRSAIR